MILDGMINVLMFLWDNVILNLFIINIPFLSFQEFSDSLQWIASAISPFTYSLNQFLPIDTLINMCFALLAVSIGIFTFKIIRFFLNLARGSGA